LGISGGMVPCPGAVVILLASLALGRLVFGIALILSFSVGLAVVLIAIGLMMVAARGLLGRMEGFAGWGRWLPLVSAAGVLTAGLFITWQALRQAGVLP